MPTTVEVYAVQPDNTTGAFVGFGSLLDPIVVFLHPAPGSVLPDKAPSEASRIGPERSAAFRPAFPREPGVALPLRDEPGPDAPSARRPGPGRPTRPVPGPAGPDRPGGKARCRILSGMSVLTIDGTFLPAPADLATAPVSVQLEVAFAGDVDRVRVPQGPGHPTAQEAADAVADFLAEAVLDDPAQPTSPPPAGPDVDPNPSHPGRRPWYCVICPGAYGC